MSHLDRLLRPFKATIVFTSVISLLASGTIGCVEEDDLDGGDGIAAAADDDDDDFRSVEQTAAAISADPLFRQLLERTVEMTAQRFLAQSQMTDEELNDFARTISEPQYSEVIDLDVFLEATGMARATVDQQMLIAQQLITKYDLGGYSSEQIENLFSLAASSPESMAYIEGAIEYELNEVEGTIDTEVDACEALCIAQFVAAVAIAFNAYVVALAAGTAAGPFWPVVVATATATYAFAIAQAEGAKDNCFAVCNGENPTDDECVHDSDCANNEYCWTGVVGIGKNECRPEKSEGKTCSRHGQCTSNCCKLHFWTNPVSKTCRPASACD